MKAGSPILFITPLISCFLLTVQLNPPQLAYAYEHQGYEPPGSYLPEEDELDDLNENESSYPGFHYEREDWDSVNNDGDNDDLP